MLFAKRVILLTRMQTFLSWRFCANEREIVFPIHFAFTLRAVPVSRPRVPFHLASALLTENVISVLVIRRIHPLCTGIQSTYLEVKRIVHILHLTRHSLCQIIVYNARRIMMTRKYKYWFYRPSFFGLQIGPWPKTHFFLPITIYN